MALRYYTALVGGTLTVLGLGSASVEAKPYRVRIESQPSGATVYVDSKEAEPLGQTPFTGKLSAGAHTLIIELEGYVSQVQDIKIRRTRRTQRIAVRLNKIELATLEIVPDRRAGTKPSDLKGARIMVDGRDVGNVPDTVKVPAGSRQVEVVKDGYRTFESWVEVAEGETLTVPADLVPIGPPRRTGSGQAGGGIADDEADDLNGVRDRRLASRGGAGLSDNGGDPEGSVGERARAARGGRTVPFIAVGAGVELGGRKYAPSEREDEGLRTFDASGVPILRLQVEANPLAFSPSPWLSGWAVLASYARGAPLDSTASDSGEMEVDVPTAWSEFHAGLGFLYPFRPGSYIGGQVGYGTQSVTFDAASAESLRGDVPDVEYSFWRFGGDGRLGFGRFAALASGGVRLVRSIGKLGALFEQTDIRAFDVGGGLAAEVTSSVEVRLVGRYHRYAHDYEPLPGGQGSAATSGLDQFFGVTLSALFVY